MQHNQDPYEDALASQTNVHKKVSEVDENASQTYIDA